MRIAEGDHPAFRQLVELYNGQVYRFVAARFAVKHPALIEEVVWDVFLQLWLTRETLPELGELENYLFILARNKGLNALKKELRELERRKHWENVMQEMVFEPVALVLREIGTADQQNSGLTEFVTQSAPASLLVRGQPRHFRTDLCELLLRRQAVGTRYAHAGAHLRAQAGDTDHEKFVEVRRRNRKEAKLLKQRMVRIRRFFKNTPVEM